MVSCLFSSHFSGICTSVPWFLPCGSRPESEDARTMAAAEHAWPAPPPFRRRDPPAPVEGEFSMYGVTRSTGPPVAPPLEEQVYDATAADVCAELRQLNRSLLQSFLELTELMAHSPSQCCDKGARPPATHPHHRTT